MSVLTAGFENGVNGNNVTTAGGEANASAWNSIVNGGGVYSNAQVAHGSLSMKMPVGSRPTLAWNTTTFEKWGRFYMWFSSAETGFSNSQWASLGGCFVGPAGSGVLELFYSSSPFGTAGAVAITRDQMVRIEYHVIPGGVGVGAIDARLYNSPDSISISESISKTGVDVGATWTTLAMGHGSVTIAGGDSYMDNIVGDALAFPGPFPVSTVSPVVTGSPSVGSTLSCDTGTWNGGATFTITYQWLRDGSPIGGSTSNAYTLTPADGGHVIACSVTATGVQATSEFASATSNGISVAGAASVPGPAPLMGRFP